MVFALFCLVSITVEAAPILPGPIVSPQWLLRHMGQVLVLDVRKLPAVGQGGAEAAGFIPGAVVVPFAQVTRSVSQNGVTLRSMRLDKPSFAKLMAQSGVSNRDVVIITNPGDRLHQLAHATRLYWTMKYFAHSQVAILDGGNAFWQAQKLPMVAKASSVQAGQYQVNESYHKILAKIADVKSGQKNGASQILDVRALKYYSGEELYEKIVPAQGRGHIPTALNLPVHQFINNSSSGVRVQNLDEIVETAQMQDIDLGSPAIIYCDTGNNGSLVWFVLHELLKNRDARLFEGSMHQWSMLNLAVTQGEEP